MAWVVDSCCVIDIAQNCVHFGAKTAACLEDKILEGLTICPITLIEIMPEFFGNLDDARFFLSQTGFDSNADWTQMDTESAARAWAEYVERKRSGTSPKRPIADILIGAFACRFEGLITRNPANFQPYFPDLTVLNPAAE